VRFTNGSRQVWSEQWVTDIKQRYNVFCAPDMAHKGFEELGSRTGLGSVDFDDNQHKAKNGHRPDHQIHH
jgi:hypothetical protein